MVGNTGACEECVRTCQLLHWSKKDIEPRVTRFFKVLIGRDYQEALFLPPKFAKTVQDLVDKETKVEDSSGTCWTVTLSHYKDLLAFHKGWSEFSVAWGLQLGDFLAVNHIKGSHFVVHVFGRDGCEKLNTATKHPPVRRARSSQNVATESTPCQATCRDAKKRKSSETSVLIQQTKTNCTPNSEVGIEKQVCIYNEFDLVVDRETGYDQSDYRACIFDLSSFEMQQHICPDGNSGKRLDGQEGSSDHAQAVVNFQVDGNLVDKNPTERVVLRKETTIDSNIVENNKDLGPMDNMSLEHVANDLPSAVPTESPADNCTDVDDKSNVVILCQTPNSSTGCLSQNPLSINRNLNEEFKMVEKEKVEKTEQASACVRERVLEPSTSGEGGSSFASVETIKIVKTEPVDSLDLPSTIDPSFTCLAVTNGSVCIELPDPLPSVVYPRGRQGRASVIIEDPKGRDWGCVYHEQFGFNVIVAPWFKINEENAIQPGDVLKFTMVPNASSLNKYKFDIVREQLDN
ncbi:hypothetical protein M9H77_24315 [Catharanthus roseus]|uniref:Uncharacterized protein n=1 Tax=Catharanthus roseus TaxID=4058 RepID=A0ACC0AVE0_CATRO|nr:hypothetical protein M9H77_24315 [Catharanthus roseus]